MVWCGMMWCGVAWCGVVWYDVVWYDVVWCGMVWCGTIKNLHNMLSHLDRQSLRIDSVQWSHQNLRCRLHEHMQ